MVDAHGPVRGHPPGGPGRLEHLGEVARLADVRDVDDPLGLLLRDALPERREVRRGVVEPAVRLADDQRVRGPLREDALGAVGELADPLVSELREAVRDQGVVEGLAPLNLK